jgi:TfoX/Sxy family transcriptional regulator of competence genes
MSYDEYFTERIRKAFQDQRAVFEEKKMMGGVCFMVNDKMCAGIIKNKLMARIDPEAHSEALTRKGCTEMVFTRKPMKGFVFVEPEGIDTDTELESWIRLCLDYNPKAKSSKKK